MKHSRGNKHARKLKRVRFNDIKHKSNDDKKIENDSSRIYARLASEDEDVTIDMSPCTLLLPGKESSSAAECFRTRLCVIGIFFAVLLIISIIAALCVVFSQGTGNPSAPISPNDTSINNDPTIPGVRIVPRIEWGAQPPENPANKLSIIPVPYVIISHTATNFCYTQAQCVFIVRVTQTFHIESKGWDDIAYNFLVGGDGLVYEGRGWDVEGAHTFNYNVKSIGISFIGTFNKQEPTNAQLYAAKKLIEYGVQNGKIAKDYKLLGHRQCIKTESPGQALYDIIRTWDKWSPAP